MRFGMQAPNAGMPRRRKWWWFPGRVVVLGYFVHQIAFLQESMGWHRPKLCEPQTGERVANKCSSDHGFFWR